MTTIIFAAGAENRHPTLPLRSLIVINNETILSRQIRLLKFCGENVIVAVGNDKIKRKYPSLNCYKVSEETNNLSVMETFLEMESVWSNLDKVNFIYGDTVFTQKTLQQSLNAKIGDSGLTFIQARNKKNGDDPTFMLKANRKGINLLQTLQFPIKTVSWRLYPKDCACFQCLFWWVEQDLKLNIKPTVVDGRVVDVDKLSEVEEAEKLIKNEEK